MRNFNNPSIIANAQRVRLVERVGHLDSAKELNPTGGSDHPTAVLHCALLLSEAMFYGYGQKLN